MAYSSGCLFRRYADAARIRDEAHTGLIGWWAGRGENDPYGHLLHVSPGFGCYTGRAYLPKSLFEIKASALQTSHVFSMRLMPAMLTGMHTCTVCQCLGLVAAVHRICAQCKADKACTSRQKIQLSSP